MNYNFVSSSYFAVYHKQGLQKHEFSVLWLLEFVKFKSIDTSGSHFKDI